MAEIIKKIDKESFDKILSGEKDFEVRLADEDYHVGDFLILKEIDKNRNFTGREIKKQIKYLVKTKECAHWPNEDISKYGLVILDLK